MPHLFVVFGNGAVAGEIARRGGVHNRPFQPAAAVLVIRAHLRLCAHEPFDSIEKAIENRSDIHSEVTVFETRENRLRVSDTDTGRELAEQVEGLKSLLEYYESCAAAGISSAAGK